AFHQLGLVGMDLPEAWGFGGISLTARALVEEELAAGDLGAAVALDATGLAGEVLRALPQGRASLAPLRDDPLSRWALTTGAPVLGGARAQYLLRIDGEGVAWAVKGPLSAEEDRDPLGISELPPAKLTLVEGERLGDAREAFKAALLRQAGV